MEGHDWEIVVALAGTIVTLSGGIIKYLLRQLEDVSSALKQMNESNMELAKMVPALMLEVDTLRKQRHEHYNNPIQ